MPAFTAGDQSRSKKKRKKISAAISPLHRDNPTSITTRGIAGSQVTLRGECAAISVTLKGNYFKTEAF